MPSKKAIIFYTLVIITAGLGIEALVCGILILDRDELINYIIRLTKRPYLLSILQQRIITPQKFVLIHWGCYAMLAINPAIVFMLFFYRKKIITSLQFVKYCVASALNSVTSVFRNNSRQANMAFLVLLLIITGRAIYYMIHFELQYDEMWSYNYFTSKPFYVSIVSYNNYPLYELSTQLFKWLPFSMKINLRLPCLLAGVASCVVLYACIKNYTRDAFMALAGVALFACMPVTTFYMLYARGVIFELFFAIVSIFCVLNIINNKPQKKYFIIFVLANAAGLYAIPTHVYFLVMEMVITVIYARRFKKEILKPFLLNNLLVMGISFICYLPVIIGSGLSFILDPPPNPALVNQIVPDLIFYNRGVGTFFTGEPYGLIFLLVLTTATTFIVKKFKKPLTYLIRYAFMLCLLPTVIYLLHRTTIAERAIPFIGFIVPLCLCIIFFVLKDRVKQYWLYAILGFLFIAGCVVSDRQSFMNWSAEQDKKAITIANLLMQNHVASCYDNAATSGFYYYYPALEYYYGQQNRAIDINVSTPNSLRYKVLTPEDNYDCIINKLSVIDSIQLKKYTPAFIDKEDGFSILLVKKAEQLH